MSTLFFFFFFFSFIHINISGHQWQLWLSQCPVKDKAQDMGNKTFVFYVFFYYKIG